MNLKLPFKKKLSLLALGAESAGLFAFYQNGQLYLSENFGDLTEETNFSKFKKSIASLIKKSPPDFILTDLHPLYNPSLYGKSLGQKLKIPVLKIQHHLAHIFSVLGEYLLEKKQKKINHFIGLACDGTGYGLDDKIWGGEIFKISNLKSQISNLHIERFGHLENQTLIGGDLAVRQPARMLLSILVKSHQPKKIIWSLLKKYYSQNEFEVLYNQVQQKYNCQETSSTARILDAVSILLGFCPNQRAYKHQPVILLEKNSTLPYQDLKPKIIFKQKEKQYNLLTSPLFNYLLKKGSVDKKRLAATAQLYLAQGLFELIKKAQQGSFKKAPIFFAGGLANNRILSSYLIKRGMRVNRLLPRGDENISFGQIVYYLKLL